MALDRVKYSVWPVSAGLDVDALSKCIYPWSTNWGHCTELESTHIQIIIMTVGWCFLTRGEN